MKPVWKLGKEVCKKEKSGVGHKWPFPDFRIDGSKLGDSAANERENFEIL